MIVDCHTYAWDAAAQLGRCIPGESGGWAPHRPVPGLLETHPVRPDVDHSPPDRSFVIGFKSRFLGAEIPNRWLAEYVTDRPDRLIGFAGIDPSNPREALADMKLAVEELGMRGVAVAPAAQDFHPTASHAMAVYAEAEQRGLPVIFHTGPFLTSQTRMDYARTFLLDEVARELPRLRIVISRLGWPWVQETIALLSKHENVFTDVCGLVQQPWQAYQGLLSASQAGVIHKVLFASGAPMALPSECIDALFGLNHLVHGTNLPPIPRDQIRAIVERDALGLLGLSPRRVEPEPSFASAVDDDELH